jgi:hemin uptake protein HemP
MIRIYNCGMDKSNELKTANKSQIRPSDGQAAQGKAVPGSGGVLRITSKRLFAGENEVEIDHNGTPYRLRQTSLGKLILTK